MCLITLPFKKLGLFIYLLEMTIFILQEFIKLISDRKQNLIRFFFFYF